MFGIIMLASSPNINFIGISTSPGNTNIHNTTQNALDILYALGRSDIPVVMGN
jgi:uridine nucleosidase